MNKEQLRSLLAQNGELSEALLPECCGPAWQLLEEGGEAAGAALTLLCRAAKKELCREALAAADHTPLRETLRADVPKQRKNAARLIGLLGRAEDTQALVDALKREDKRMVRPSMLLALGALGTPTARETLQEYVVSPAADATEEKHEREEAEALRTALSRLRMTQPHAFHGLDREYELELRPPAGFGETLGNELMELGMSPLNIRSDSLRIRCKKLEQVYRARCFSEVLFPLNHGIPARPEFLEKPGESLFNLLSNTTDGKPEYGYRIELRGQVKDRKAFIRAGVQAADRPGLVNAPSGYEAELRIEVRGALMDVYAKLFLYEDQRFVYRRQALPASIHPATAAALVRYAKEYFRPNARVLDPCCGSGTLLIERGLLSPCAALTGVDIAHKAVDIARGNAAAAGCKAKFMVNDCLRFTAHRYYDEVITNLPFGNRVGSHSGNEALYSGLVQKLPHWLAPGGIALLYTMEAKLLEGLLRRHPDLSIQKKTRTEAGGLLPYLFLVRREH